MTEGRAGTREAVLSLEGISKRFGNLIANDSITIELARGEILAVLGENGAGKTTLMNILFGHHLPDAGSITVFGRPLEPGSPHAAIAAGLGMVHQQFTLADNLSVLDNVVLGTEPLWRPWSERRRALARLNGLSRDFGLAVDPQALVGELSVGERQRVEILKALYREARILILDEPTSVLTPPETEQLFSTLRRFVARGLSVIFISHKLQEVLETSDRIVVLRAGRVVAEVRPDRTSRAALAELMVGRTLPETVRAPAAAGEPVFELEDVTVLGADGRTRLDRVRLAVRRREILGIAGVSGNGQGALSDLACGLIAPAEGTVRLFGRALEGASARERVVEGVARIPEDRDSIGLVGELSIWENLIAERYWDREFSRAGLLLRAAATGFARRAIAEYDVRCPGPAAAARQLSGGNKQKLILARTLSRRPGFVVANQPTRGLDVAAVAYVHERLLACRADGAGVLLISEDLDEILALADRVRPIYRGRLGPEFVAERLSVQELGLMMAGHLPSGIGHAA